MTITPSPSSAEDAVPNAAEDGARLETLLVEMRRMIVGQDRALERMLVCLLARGHCLLESVPGLAKTLSVETMAKAVGGSFHRIQFTPDLLPSDVIGTRIYRGSTESFDTELGPVFANFVLADEINRAPAKVQSALLEVMAEQQVSIGGTTHEVPKPFLVLATQNPIESEGVYPLPEAQRDRFLMKVVLDYPTPQEEVEIVQRMGISPPETHRALSLESLAALQAEADAVYVDRGVVEYAVNLVLCTRTPENFGLADLRTYIELGASPRASIGLVRAARAIALIRGRSFATVQDVFDVAPEILRHRLVMTYEALAQDLTPDHLLARILGTVPAPSSAVNGTPSEQYQQTQYQPEQQWAQYQQSQYQQAQYQQAQYQPQQQYQQAQYQPQQQWAAAPEGAQWAPAPDSAQGYPQGLYQHPGAEPAPEGESASSGGWVDDDRSRPS